MHLSLWSETCMVSVVPSSSGFVFVFLITEGLRKRGPINRRCCRRRLVCSNPKFDLAPDQDN